MRLIKQTSFKDVAKIDRLKEACAKQQEEKGSVFYLLPSGSWLKEARKRQPGVRYTTFDDLAAFIVNEAEGEPIYLDEHERALFFQNMMKTDERYRSFNQNQSKVRGLADTYGQIKRLGLELEDAPRSLEEFMPLFKQYEEQTVHNQKMYDPENTVLRAIELLDNQKPRVASVYIDGFIDFGPLQFILLKALVSAGIPVTIYLPIDQEFAIIQQTQKELTALGFQMHAETDLSAEPAEDVDVIAASTKNEEIRAVLEEIRMSPLLYEETGIIVVDEKDGASLLRYYAEQYKIPLNVPIKKSLDCSISFQFIHKLLTWDYSKTNRFELLPLIDQIFTLHGLKGIDYVKAKEAFLATGDIIHQESRELYQRIKEFNWRKSSSFYHYLKQLSQAVIQLELDGKWRQRQGQETRTSELKDIVFELKTIERLTELVSDYAEKLEAKHLTDLHMTLDVFADWVLELAKRTELFTARGSKRGIQVHTWRDIGLFEGKKMYVIGMNEGAFPAVHQLGGYVHEKDLYNLPVEGALPTQEHFRHKQQAYFGQLLLAAKSIVCTYTKGLDPNHPHLPSPFIEQWLQKDGRECTFEARMKHSISFSKEDQIEKTAYHMGLGMKVLEPAAELVQLSQRHQYLSEGEEKLEEAHQDSLMKNTVSITELESYARCPFKHGLERVLQVGEVKSIQERISPIDIGQMIHTLIESIYKELDLIGVPFGECTEEIKNEVPVLLKEKFEELWEQIESTAFEISRLDLLLEKEKWWRKINRWWQAERKHFWDNPHLSEMKIHSLETSLRLELELDEGTTLHLTGKVDRVDLDQEGFTIYDYKTGFAHVKLEEEVRSGLKLQLPLYARALKEQLSTTDAALRAHGASYISLREPEKRAGNGIWRSDQIGKSSKFLVHHSCKNKEDDLGGDEFMEVYELRNKVHSLWKGTHTEFSVRPLDCSSYCPYKSVCRVTEDQKEGLY
ncbi:hypothetical protein BpOF4_02565 [Alkalihalophilus pseudofirmus OF4]|uniref:Uncharacterized protein n=1 Tax=Alkalihalophilus pseudofirmus (strain ATCC BAA-2126 / JCM 17055 / OF4) TaxID=398511 RepID=D3FVR5_ALKPO|nr:MULTISPECIES: PD-(D/E)XK nuclease family protein [Alkalihalophilus]ADC48580.1 hypothetical protein BpOF4_02565 [Alkalihalophilus pseudofirmus OF4]MED1600924.1 PD-(D/E)XK nuclease family protein [Alkalihalophilus marmarensis]